MPGKKFQSVAEYIAAQPPQAQAALQKVRAAIRRAIPTAQEVIAYNIAGYKLDGRNAIFFAGWKHHYSLYPASASMAATFAGDLKPYEVEKGTIRFPLAGPVPVKLITALARHRAAELAASPAGRRRKPQTAVLS